MRLSTAALEILRSQPQSTQLYLSIFQPQVLFTAQVNNASAARGDRVITYDNASGTYTSIESGMTMWIGSTPGANDIGKIRVRSATNTTITVSENSGISWRDNLYLTVFRYWELWPIFIRIIPDPNNTNNVIFYKDYDIAYTNQNSTLGTFVNAGPHRAIMLDPATQQAQIYYTSTGSYNMLGDALSYSWTFQGACGITGSTLATPGYITYCTPGNYVTKLVISGSSGEVDTTYRYVSVYNDQNPPIQRWQLNELRGSRDEGGYTASIKVFETIPLQQNAVVVIFGQSQYGTNVQNIGGNAQNASDIFFVGYIDKDTISYDYQHSEVSFDAVSITSLMKKSSGFSVSVQSKANPAYWYELLDMDSRRALYHYFRWHTTVLLFNDFQYLGDDYKIQFFDSDRLSMYDAVNNYMRDTMIGQVVSDRQGKVWAEVQAMAYTNPTGTFTPVMDITKRDWRNTPNIEERLNQEVAYAEYGGVAYSGVVTGTFAALIGSAPGNAPGFYGGIDNHEGQALLGQDQLNSLVGNVTANKNSPYPVINMEMSEVTTNLDIAPQEVVGVHITKDDTIRNLAIDGLYIPDAMSWKYDPNGLKLLPQIDYKQLVNGLPGETVTIPVTPENNIGAGFNVPIFSFPMLPPLTFPTSTVPSVTKRVIIHDKSLAGGVGLLYTETLDKVSPSWLSINGGLPSNQWLACNKIVVCPNGSLYAANLAGGADCFIARAPYIGGPFTNVINPTTINDIFGIGSGPQILMMECDPTQSEEVIFACGNSNGFAFFRGSNLTYVQVPAMHGIITTSPGNVTFGIGSQALWLWSDLNGDIKSFPQSYASFSVLSPGLGFGNAGHVRAGTTGKTIHPFTSAGHVALRIADNNYSTYVDVNPPVGTSLSYTPLPIRLEYLMALDNIRQYILTEGSSGGQAIISIDGGNSFFPVAGLPTGLLPNSDARVYTFAHGVNDASDSEWIASDRRFVYYNNTGGDGNWYDKSGNLPLLTPAMDVNVIVAVG